MLDISAPIWRCDFHVGALIDDCRAHVRPLYGFPILAQFPVCGEVGKAGRTARARRQDRGSPPAKASKYPAGFSRNERIRLGIEDHREIIQCQCRPAPFTDAEAVTENKGLSASSAPAAGPQAVDPMEHDCRQQALTCMASPGDVTVTIRPAFRPARARAAPHYLRAASEKSRDGLAGIYVSLPGSGNNPR